MPPAYFALVMSTGIISIACHLLDLRLLGQILLWLNLGLYSALWLLTLLRIVYYPAQILSDLKSLTRSMGFFTTVAATGVLGGQLVILLEAGAWGGLRLWLGLGLWLFCMYAVLTALISRASSEWPAFAFMSPWRPGSLPFWGCFER